MPVFYNFYINILFGNDIISDDEANISSPKLNINYHYKVIDIKHSTIHLKADGKHILNTESSPAYKGQIYIYVIALNDILGININKGFIWGKKYKYESKGIKYEINDFLTKPGIIDFDSVDSNYVEITNKAIKWVRAVRNESSTWTLLPIPCRAELFPNMKNERETKYKFIKNKKSFKEKINN